MPHADHWDPSHPAIWREKAPGEHRALALRHPAYPYERPTGDLRELPEIASQYLRKVGPLFELPGLFDPSDPQTAHFTWPLAWLRILEDEPAPPRSSFWIRRRDTSVNPSPVVDRTIVLLALQSAAANESEQVIGSRLGVRIVAHVDPKPVAGPWRVRITSSACSADLRMALTPYPERIQKFFNNLFSLGTFRANLEQLVHERAGVNRDGLRRSDGYRILTRSGGGGNLEFYLHVSPSATDPEGLAYALTAKLDVGPTGLVDDVEIIEICPFVAHVVTGKLFPQDPASQVGAGKLVEVRPSRAPARLEKYRSDMDLAGLTPDGVGNTPLTDAPLNQVRVTQSRLAEPAADESLNQVVRPATLGHTRTNRFAALSAYRSARRLFDTMRAYGLLPGAYFRFATLPLLVRYRAPIKPGPGKDGRTINAQVNYFPPDSDLLGIWDSSKVKPVEVRFALADLRRSTSRREPLGLAADERWSWHEYCHVLLAASTGALELHFAHSAGDALAAIMCDPDSLLVIQPGMRDELRGATFPWVYLNRRHDRPVFYGWSWCGRFHRADRFPAVGSNCRRKAYQSEQILSTSLFRLYRALGGDTLLEGEPDRPKRRAAADYTAYLIMRAIGSLGPAAWAVVETPDQLVSALTDADIATLPVSAGPLKDRVGGWAHKAVRWAFEAQGLYAADPLAVTDAPGEPPPVDVFIDDGRDDSEGRYPRGGYMPASLDWDGTPAWHAAREALKITGNQVSVEVRNRGQNDAAGVTVGVWWADWPAIDPPKWSPAKWTSLGVSAPTLVPAWSNPPATPTKFGPFAGIPTTPPGRRVLILAAATCPADPANTDAATGLPCTTHETPIVDLVAGDNNLGLRPHVVP